MSANVEITDTFDQWRTKANEWISMTQSAGSSEFIKLNNTTNSTSNTTGSITTLGGIGITKSAVVGGNLTVFGDVDVDGTINVDAVDIDGAVQLDGTLTVGVDGTGYDVKFFGDTSGSYMLWDEDVDDLILAGASTLSIDTTTDSSNTTTGSFHTDGGVGIAKKLYVGTDLDVDGTTNLDIVDIDGAVQLDATFSVGVDNTGYDVKLFGATASSYWLWDEDADGVVTVGDLQQTGTITVGVDGTGHDVKFFGATASAYMLWDEDEDDLVLSGVAALSIDTATDSSSTTTGSFHTDGGVGIAKKLYVGTDLDVNGTTNLDIVDIDGAVQIDAALSVGVDNTGYDVKFFGATASAFMLWDQSEDDLVLSGVAALSIDTATDATNTTSGSFHTDGGVGIAKKLYVGTDLDVDGTSNLDAVDIDGAVQLDATLSVGVDNTGYDVKLFGATSGSYWLWDEDADGVVTVGDLQQTGTITVGVDNTGHDVKFFGATSGAYMLWDEDVDDLILAGAAALSIDATTDATNTTSGSFHTDGGVGIAKKLYVGTDLDVDGTTNLDIVDIDGAVQLDATLSVGVDNTGYDVKFFGATSGSYWLWDEDADKTIQVGSSQITGALTVGVDDTGHDVIFYGAAAGAFMMWDENVNSLLVRGASADAAGSSGRIVLQTAQTDVQDADIIGRIDWNAVAEHSTDGNDVGASIWAEADATFSATVNSTDLVFATGDSGVATEKFRIDSTGVCTFADGAIDVDIASHDGSNGLKLGGTLVTSTAAEINAAATIGKQIAMALVF
jgi:hypothetical protein